MKGVMSRFPGETVSEGFDYRGNFVELEYCHQTQLVSIIVNNALCEQGYYSFRLAEYIAKTKIDSVLDSINENGDINFLSEQCEQIR